MAVTTNIAIQQQQAARYFNISEATFLFWIHLFNIHKSIRKMLKNEKDMDPRHKHDYKAMEQALLYWLNLNKVMVHDARMGGVRHSSLTASQYAFDISMSNSVAMPSPEGLMERTMVRAKQGQMMDLYTRLLPDMLETNLMEITRLIFYSPVENRVMTYWVFIALGFAEVHGMSMLSMRLQQCIDKMKYAHLFQMPCFCILPFVRRALTRRLVTGFLTQTLTELPFPIDLQTPEQLKETEFTFPDLVTRSPLVHGQNTLISNMFYPFAVTLPPPSSVVPVAIAPSESIVAAAAAPPTWPEPPERIASSGIRIKGPVGHKRHKASSPPPVTKRSKGAAAPGLQILNVAIDQETSLRTHPHNVGGVGGLVTDWKTYRWDHYPNKEIQRAQHRRYTQSSEFKAVWRPYVERLGNPTLSYAHNSWVLMKRMKKPFLLPQTITSTAYTTPFDDLPVLCRGEIYRAGVAAGEKDLCRPRPVKEWIAMWIRIRGQAPERGAPEDRHLYDEEDEDEDEEVMQNHPIVSTKASATPPPVAISTPPAQSSPPQEAALKVASPSRLPVAPVEAPTTSTSSCSTSCVDEFVEGFVNYSAGLQGRGDLLETRWTTFVYDYYPQNVSKNDITNRLCNFSRSKLYQDSLEKCVPPHQRAALVPLLFRAFKLLPGKMIELFTKYPQHLVLCRGRFYEAAKKAGEKDLCRPRPVIEWFRMWERMRATEEQEDTNDEPVSEGSRPQLIDSTTESDEIIQQQEVVDDDQEDEEEEDEVKDWMAFTYDYYPSTVNASSIRKSFAKSKLYRDSLTRWVPRHERLLLSMDLGLAFRMKKGKLEKLAKAYPQLLVLCRGHFYDFAKKLEIKDLCRPRPLLEWHRLRQQWGDLGGI